MLSKQFKNVIIDLCNSFNMPYVKWHLNGVDASSEKISFVHYTQNLYGFSCIFEDEKTFKIYALVTPTNARKTGWGSRFMEGLLSLEPETIKLTDDCGGTFWQRLAALYPEVTWQFD